MQHNDINITNNIQPNIAGIFLYSCKVKLIIFEKTVMEGHLSADPTNAPSQLFTYVRALHCIMVPYFDVKKDS